MRWALFGAVMIACVALGYGAYTLAGISWDAVVDYDPPFTELAIAEAGSGSETTSRTVLVIIDGLRLDASREMNTLRALRSSGTEVVVTAPQPSLSYPNWTTILSGAPPEVSGVATNWHEGQAPAETLFDTARRSGVPAVFVGPEDFDVLYGVREKSSAAFMKQWDKEYLSGEYVDAALRLAEREQPRLLIVHLPDVDEAGHDFGGASEEYAATVAKVDADLGRLVDGLQDGATSFLIVADHGHIDTGGHGGWEPEVVQLSAVLAGPGVSTATGEGKLEDVAPTVAVMAGVPSPRHAVGVPLEPVVNERNDSQGLDAAADSRLAFATEYARTVSGLTDATAEMTADELFASSREVREASDRRERLPWGLAIAAASLLAIGLVWIASWRVLVSALAGTAAYYLVYNVLFFTMHGYKWSLSAFNSEDLVQSWMNGRLIEAAVAGVVAALVAAVVYPPLRVRRLGPHREYLPGWLTLGPTTMLVILATLGLQVAWFVWAWGIFPEWRLPDLMWGFKYDLDLIQATAVGFVAVVTPLVTYLVGRFHPMIIHPHMEEWPHGDQGPA